MSGHRHKWKIVVEGTGDSEDSVFVLAVCECGQTIGDIEIEKRLNLLERMAD